MELPFSRSDKTSAKVMSFLCRRAGRCFPFSWRTLETVETPVENLLAMSAFVTSNAESLQILAFSFSDK